MVSRLGTLLSSLRMDLGVFDASREGGLLVPRAAPIPTWMELGVSCAEHRERVSLPRGSPMLLTAEFGCSRHWMYWGGDGSYLGRSCPPHSVTWVLYTEGGC